MDKFAARLEGATSEMLVFSAQFFLVAYMIACTE